MMKIGTGFYSVREKLFCQDPGDQPSAGGGAEGQGEAGGPVQGSNFRSEKQGGTSLLLEDLQVEHTHKL